MKSMVLKGLVMVGALALINCDNNTVVAPGPDELGTKPESSAAIEIWNPARVLPRNLVRQLAHSLVRQSIRSPARLSARNLAR